MILRKLQFLGAFLVVGVGGYSFGFFGEKVDPVEYCQANFSNAGDIMEYRLENSNPEYALMEAKNAYSFTSNDKYSEIILENLIESAYNEYVPQVSNGYRKAINSFSKKTYKNCLQTFEELGYEVRQKRRGGVLNKISNRQAAGY